MPQNAQPERYVNDCSAGIWAVPGGEPPRAPPPRGASKQGVGHQQQQGDRRGHLLGSERHEPGPHRGNPPEGSVGPFPVAAPVGPKGEKPPEGGKDLGAPRDPRDSLGVHGMDGEEGGCYKGH